MSKVVFSIVTLSMLSVVGVANAKVIRNIHVQKQLRYSSYQLRQMQLDESTRTLNSLVLLANSFARSRGGVVDSQVGPNYVLRFKTGTEENCLAYFAMTYFECSNSQTGNQKFLRDDYVQYNLLDRNIGIYSPKTK